MHPDERSARPTDARYRATSNVPSPDTRPESGTSPSRSQAQVATRRIAYAVLISLGVLLMLAGGGRRSPQFYLLGILILIGVSLHNRIRARARKARARSAKRRASATPPATAYTQPAARPVVAHPPPLSDAHDAIIRETHRRSGSPDGDGQGPTALPAPERGRPLPAIWRGAQLSAQGMADVVQRAVERIGLDVREFTGHSLRSGFATEAAAQDASERAIMRQIGHRSVTMLRRYIRAGERYRDNAAAVLGEPVYAVDIYTKAGTPPCTQWTVTPGGGRSIREPASLPQDSGAGA